MANFKGKIFETVGEETNAKIITYVAPESSWKVTAHVIVTENETLTIDTQMTEECIKELASIIYRQGKSVNRVIVSHAHPDHFAGLGKLREGKVNGRTYAGRETIMKMKYKGQYRINQVRDMGIDIPDLTLLPERVLEEGKYDVDGLTMMAIKQRKVESCVQFVFAFPELGTMIIQDLVYNGHAYLNDNIESWRSSLLTLLLAESYDNFLVGHGNPVNREFVERYTQYLEDAQRFINESVYIGEFRNKLLAAYPDYDFKMLVGMRG